MLPLAYSQPLTKHGRHPSCVWDSSCFCVYRNPLTEESSKLLLEDFLLAGLKLPWKYTEVLGSFSPLLLPFSFLLGIPAIGSIERNWENWRKERTRVFLLHTSASCDTSSSICSCFHVSISLHIIYLFLLWSSPLLAAPTEPLTPFNYYFKQTITIGLGMDKY